jgi:DNA-directed RNA polymerase specialized sigma24 family protein
MLGGEEGAADLVQRTFERAYQWAGKHAGDSKALAKLKGPTPDDARLRIRAWLGKIAENLFKDALRAAKRSPIVELTDELFATVPSAEPDEDIDLSDLPPGARVVLAEELAALKPQDLEIITMSLPWYDPKSRQFALAPGEAEKLAASLGIEVDALRQRRHRAMKGLTDAVLARLEEQKSKGGTR